MNKIKMAVVFGGKSSEYSVSLHSAASLLKNCSEELYDLVLIGITKDGDWYVYTLNCNELNIIFKNGHGWNGDKNQTEDLKGIRESVCYQLAQEGDAKATATAVDCPAAE